MAPTAAPMSVVLSEVDEDDDGVWAERKVVVAAHTRPRSLEQQHRPR